jgi:hypothetical protein
MGQEFKPRECPFVKQYVTYSGWAAGKFLSFELWLATKKLWAEYSKKLKKSDFLPAKIPVIDLN